MREQLKLDNDVIKALIDRAIENKQVKILINGSIDSGKFFNSEIDLSELLRPFLGMNNNKVDANNNYPNSQVPEVQILLDGLRATVFSISKDGMKFYGIHRRWVSNPNIVTITVQDARAHNLRMTVYGKPYEFEELKPSLEIKDDMSGYSRFVINHEGQLPSVIKVIQHSNKLKNDRWRLRKNTTT